MKKKKGREEEDETESNDETECVVVQLMCNPLQLSVVKFI